MKKWPRLAGAALRAFNDLRVVDCAFVRQSRFTARHARDLVLDVHLLRFAAPFGAASTRGP